MSAIRTPTRSASSTPARDSPPPQVKAAQDLLSALQTRLPPPEDNKPSEYDPFPEDLRQLNATQNPPPAPNTRRPPLQTVQPTTNNPPPTEPLQVNNAQNPQPVRPPGIPAPQNKQHTTDVSDAIQRKKNNANNKDNRKKHPAGRQKGNALLSNSTQVQPSKKPKAPAKKRPKIKGPAPFRLGKSRPGNMRPMKRKKTQRRMKQGILALREIRYYQKDTAFIIPKMPFARLVREIAFNVSYDKFPASVRFEADALSALQEAAESHIVRVFEKCNLAAIHAKRITVMQKDMEHTRSMCDGFVADPALISGAPVTVSGK